jgi:hypothetical protein
MIHRCFGTRSSSAILSLFLLAGLFVPEAHARSKEKHKDPLQPTEVGIYLVGHLSLPETSVSNIASSGDPDRQSIALSDAAHGTLTLVDVTHPERPRFVQQSSLPREFSRAALKVQAGNVGLLSGRETDAAAGSQSITLVSFADPAHAATLQKFEGVTALWTDPERELIYLANPDGLWILQIYSTADKRAAEQFDEMLKGSGG